jgi:4-amino-4-deoxy-L-arabinose transferase-like glycosyltransferase
VATSKISSTGAKAGWAKVPVAGYGLLTALLIATQWSFLPLPGIHADEAFFVAPFLRNRPALYSWTIFGHHVAVMAMSYVGALKSWLYWPVFHIWMPGVWSMRVPVSLLSGLSLILFVDLIRRVTGLRIALAAGLLLATDAVFVLMNVFDITVPLLLLGMAALLNALWRFAATGRRRFLVTAFLAAGLALWYKAVFVFPLAGVLTAFVLVYPHEVRPYLTRRNLLLGALSLCIGAAPLIVFNVASGWDTVRSAPKLPKAPLAEKALMLELTLNGRALEHYMVRSSFDDKIAVSGAPLGNLVLSWYRRSHFLPGSLLVYAVGLSFAALPFLRGARLFRPLLFAWIAGAVTIGSMWMLRDAGSGPHHTILCYPAPHFLVAATGAALLQGLSVRASSVMKVLLAVLVGSNLWLLAEYYRAARVNGFSVYWTNGMGSLAEVISAQPLPVVCLDWGICSGLQIEVHDGIPFLDDPTPREGVLFVSHCDDSIIDVARTSQFQEALATSGLRAKSRQVVPDKQGHPVFCLFRLAWANLVDDGRRTQAGWSRGETKVVFCDDQAGVRQRLLVRGGVAGLCRQTENPVGAQTAQGPTGSRDSGSSFR